MKENITASALFGKASDEAFTNLMEATERALNAIGSERPETFRNISAFDLEIIVCDTLKEQCRLTSSPFSPEEINLVSGAKFPDIVVGKHYGVEVKSTAKDHWTSVGSSIMESTRVGGVKLIHLMFGKLGGARPEFRSRPYEDVLPDIAVTHSPRYLIDMNLVEGESIFNKMGIPYDVFRSDGNAISNVRHYYISEARKEGKTEMSWWLEGGNDGEASSAITLKLWDDLSKPETEMLKAQIFILFPEVLRSDFGKAALWLCTSKGVINYHLRDLFTSGGGIDLVNGETVSPPLPKVYKTIVDIYPMIRKFMADNEFVDTQISEFNPALLHGDGIYQTWLNQVLAITREQRLQNWMETGARMSKKK